MAYYGAPNLRQLKEQIDRLKSRKFLRGKGVRHYGNAVYDKTPVSQPNETALKEPPRYTYEVTTRDKIMRVVSVLTVLIVVAIFAWITLDWLNRITM